MTARLANLSMDAVLLVDIFNPIRNKMYFQHKNIFILFKLANHRFGYET